MSNIVSFGPFALSIANRLLMKDGVALHLGGRALDILIILVERAGVVVGNKELLTHAWPGLTVDESALRVHIAGLRKVLGDGKQGARFIINVPGRGYSFVGQISPSRKAKDPSQSNSIYRHPTFILPPHLQRMVGRKEAVQIISEQLVAHRFVNIVGPGGMGKTTVAIAVGHGMHPDFKGEVAFVDLSHIVDPLLVPTTVASTLGLGLQGSEPSTSLIASLVGRKLLLILDNCEHVIDGVAPLAERIFRDAPEVHVLATSRETLRVEGEYVYRLEPLESPDENATLTSAEAMTFPAIQLFVERAAARGAPINLNDDDARVVGEICRNLDGIALAIELAAGRVNAHGVLGTAALLQNRFRLEWQGRRTAIPRHQTLNSMLDWSCNLLSDHERLILGRLAVFVGQFSLDGAEAVAGEPPESAQQIAEVLEQLIDKSLVSTITSGATTRYRLLETTRSYALVKLNKSDELDAIAEKHARFYNSLFCGFESTNAKIDIQGALFSVPAYLGNIRAALNWCFSEAGNTLLGISLAAKIAPFFMAISLLDECVFWCNTAISALPDSHCGTSVELELQDAVARSSMFTAQGGVVGIRTAFERSMILVGEHGDRGKQLRLLASFNVFLLRIGEFQTALNVARRAAAVALSTSDTTAIVISNWIQGNTHHITGNQISARSSCEAGFAQAAAISEADTGFFGFGHRIRALTALARARWISGFPDQARSMARQAIDEAAGDRLSACISLVYAPTVFVWCGDRHTAYELSEKLIAMAKRYTLTAFVGTGIGLKGEFLVRSGEAAAGVKLLRQALTISHEEKHNIQLMSFTTALAEGLSALGQHEAALTAIDEAIAQVVSNGNSFDFPEMLRIRGDILSAIPEVDRSEAEACLFHSLDKAQSQGDLSWELRTAMSLAQLMSKQGRSRQGKALLADVYGRFTEGFATADLQRASFLLGE